ncbi:MAG: glycosyltransferase family 2 protein [Cytophagales bacterium]
MIIALPMAGRGSRFEGAGFEQPKPLIPVHDVPMFVKSLQSVKNLEYTLLAIIALQEHEERFEISAIIEKYNISNAKLILIPDVTKGQLCTVMALSDLLNTDEDLLVMGSDTIVVSDLGSHLKEHLKNCDGAISVFDLPGDRWSFAKTDERGNVIQVAEKVRISNHACTGLYYFKHSSIFKSLAEKMIAGNETTKGEFYVMPLYQKMIDLGMNIGISIAKEMWDLGTPEALNLYYQHFPDAHEH